MVKNFLVKLAHIIEGNFKRIFKIETPFEKEKQEICHCCIYEKYQKGYGLYCELCGCLIKAKTKVKDEHCVIEKW